MTVYAEYFNPSGDYVYLPESFKPLLYTIQIPYFFTQITTVQDGKTKSVFALKVSRDDYFKVIRELGLNYPQCIQAPSKEMIADLALSLPF